MLKVKLQIWKSIPGYEGYYEVSDHGNIRALKRTIIRRDGRTVSYSEKLCAQTIIPNKDGYLRVTVGLSKDNKVTIFVVARLVLLAFIGNPSSRKHQARHLNGDSLYNNLSNLAWGSPKENCQDKVDMGRSKHTEETKKKMSESHKGVPRPPFSEETRNKMSWSVTRSWIKRKEKDKNGLLFDNH